MLTEIDPTDEELSSLTGLKLETRREARDKQAARAKVLNRQQRELMRSAIERMAERSLLLESWYQQPQ